MTYFPDLPDDALIRLPDVLRVIPISKSTFFAGQAKGLFPESIAIGPRAKAYRVGDIRAWLRDPSAWALHHKRTYCHPDTPEAESSDALDE